MMTRLLATCSLLALGACAVVESDATRTEITQANDLGVTSIEVARFDDHGDHVFELRGLDANDQEVALVRQRIGMIEDLPRYLPGDDLYGSELVFSAGQEYRLLSREVRSFEVGRFGSDPKLQGFLDVAAVASALHGSNIRVEASPSRAAAGERAYDGYVVYGDSFSCNAGQLNTTPVANQCCQTEYALYDNNWSYQEARYQNFKAASGANAGLLIQKNLAPTSFSTQTCVSQTGGSCSGQDCYYGPNGFRRPYVFAGTSSYSVTAQWVYNVPEQPFLACGWSSSGGTEGEWPAVTGTFPTSQGCPGGASGAGQWNY